VQGLYISSRRDLKGRRCVIDGEIVRLDSQDEAPALICHLRVD
jgi:ATP-dependent DNA ligase